jgi:hypothetical protein
MACARAGGHGQECVRSGGGSPGKRERRARVGETDEWGRLTVGPS